MFVPAKICTFTVLEETVKKQKGRPTANITLSQRYLRFVSCYVMKMLYGV